MFFSLRLFAARQRSINPPKVRRERAEMSDLRKLEELVSRLRGKNGCPWDREQTHQSVKWCLIEEAYEVAEAIDQGDDQKLKEELGDLLFQVMFHAQIAQEEGRFNISDVIATNVEKLKRRHPHVFGDVKVESTEEVLMNWEKIKNAEGRGSVLDGVPSHLPALLRAKRVQEKAARVGFDWKDTAGVLEKIEEELAELVEVWGQNEPKRAEEEMGDVLFSLTNLARFLHICPEEALHGSTDRFIRRFKFIESELQRQGKTPQTACIDEMDALWEKAKQKIK